MIISPPTTFQIVSPSSQMKRKPMSQIRHKLTGTICLTLRASFHQTSTPTVRHGHFPSQIFPHLPRVGARRRRTSSTLTRHRILLQCLQRLLLTRRCVRSSLVMRHRLSTASQEPRITSQRLMQTLSYLLLSHSVSVPKSLTLVTDSFSSSGISTV